MLGALLQFAVYWTGYIVEGKDCMVPNRLANIKGRNEIKLSLNGIWRL